MRIPRSNVGPRCGAAGISEQGTRRSTAITLWPDVIRGDHDRDQRVVHSLVDVGHVLWVLGEPVAGRNDAEADSMRGQVVE